MNIVLRLSDQTHCFDNMRPVLNALKLSAQDYDWYLSNIGATNYDAVDQWMTGEELHDLIFNHNIQFIWGVISAVPRGYRCKIVDAPFVFSNQAYKGKVECTPQLKEASFEIAFIDGNVIILIGLSAEAASNFCEVYPDAMPLSKYNLINGARRQPIKYNFGYKIGRFLISLPSYLKHFRILHAAPLTEKQFTQIAAKKLREKLRNIQPAINVAVVGDLGLMICESQGKLFSMSLGSSLYYEYAGGTKIYDVIELCISSLLETKRLGPLDRTRIIPIVKNRNWMTETQELLKQHGSEQVHDFVYEDLNEVLVIVYTELTEKYAACRFLESKSLEEIGIIRSQLRTFSVGNLTRLIDMPRIDTGKLVSMTSFGWYEPSFLLLDDFWASLPKVEGEIVVAVPAEVILMFTGSLNEPGLNKLRELAAKYAKDFPGPISEKLFVYRNGHLTLFE